MIEVIIADDHPLVREGIRGVIKKEIDIKVIGEASDGRELIKELRTKSPSIVITDMVMPGKSGLELIKDVNHLYPNLSILVLTVHSGERYGVRAIKAGASGYLNKASISDELIKAIRHITIRKRKYISLDLAEELARQACGTNKAHELLSDREFEVLRLIAEGKEVKQIANKLNLSSNTIHTYRNRIKEKLNVKSNVEMTRYAFDNDLI